MTTGRWRAALALLLYVAVGLGAPLADGLVAHGGPASALHHIEAAGDPGCHAAACVLDAPGAPHSPAVPPVGGAPITQLAVAAPARLATQHLDRPDTGPLGSRAPPSTD